MRPTAAPVPPVAIAGALAVAMSGSLLLRTGALDAGYWIDEAISVGIASYDLGDIPGALRKDGSPPLYYLLLHGWMRVAGTGEAATRALSLVFALLAVPVAWWTGRAVFDRRAAAVAAAAAATCPFLTHYAQETRMYSLVALLSLLASAAFVQALLHGRRRQLAWLAAWTVLLLYTHTWGVFLAAGMAVAWLVLWREGRLAARDGVLLGAVVGIAYAPWIPSLVFQVAHTAAPWAERPSPLYLLGVALAGAVALQRRAARDGVAPRHPPDSGDAARVLALIVAVAAGLAWLASQAQPAWSARYLAVLFGPLLLALAGTASRRSGWTAAALAGVAAAALAAGPPPVKSNARSVATQLGPAIRPGDLVVSTQPEQVPVLHRYLPAGVVYLTPIGIAADPRLTDWRNGVARMRDGRAEAELLPQVDVLPAGRRILLVTPVAGRSPPQSPWSRAVRVRTREWRAALRADLRLRPIGRASPSVLPPRRSRLRAELFEVVQERLSVRNVTE
jgi:mannosyltransferase